MLYNINRMKIFFGVPYSSKVDTTGAVLPEYRNELEQMIAIATDLGNTAFCAPQHDGWHLNSISAADAFLLDTNELRTSDAFIGIVESDNPSIGACMEVMLANELNLPTLIITDKENPVYMEKGMVAARDNVTHAVCPTYPEMRQKVADYITQLDIY